MTDTIWPAEPKILCGPLQQELSNFSHRTESKLFHLHRPDSLPELSLPPSQLSPHLVSAYTPALFLLLNDSGSLPPATRHQASSRQGSVLQCTSPTSVWLCAVIQVSASASPQRSGRLWKRYNVTPSDTSNTHLFYLPHGNNLLLLFLLYGSGPPH